MADQLITNPDDMQKVAEAISAGSLKREDVWGRLSPGEQTLLTQVEKQANTPLLKTALTTAGMALPGLAFPEVALPMWAMEALGGAMGNMLGGMNGGKDESPVENALYGAGPALIGPGIGGLGKLMQHPIGGAAAGTAAAESLGLPWWGGAAAGRMAGKPLGRALEVTGDTIEGLTPGSLMKRARSGVGAPDPVPNAPSAPGLTITGTGSPSEMTGTGGWKDFLQRTFTPNLEREAGKDTSAVTQRVKAGVTGAEGQGPVKIDPSRSPSNLERTGPIPPVPSKNKTLEDLMERLGIVPKQK